jgi:AraC family transcriptional activator FtrA
VTALAYDRLCTFELGLVVEVFALPRPELGIEDWYRFDLCSADPAPLRATGGITIGGARPLADLVGAGTVVIPGWRDAQETPPPEAVEAVRRAHDAGARVVSICSGVFVLAAAGLLAGRRATTHWRYSDLLARRHPDVQVCEDVLYVDEGDVATSAGSAAGLDLCLHLVRRDFGAEVANHVARRLVVPPHRDGGQAQYLPEPVRPVGVEAPLAAVLDWAREHLDRPLPVAHMARRANMSGRTFARRFRREIGTSPAHWVQRQRVLAAQRLLETTDVPIDVVAASVGLGSAANLRHHFRAVLATTPTAYRSRFLLSP